MAALPARNRRRVRRFMLTPLVDVIFLLLTFFMLSSHVAPYSLLALAARQPAAATDDSPPVGALAGLVVSVAGGSINANGTRYTPEGFRAAAASLAPAVDGEAIVLTRSSASVQDVVTVLEILRKSGFSTVSVRMRGRAGG